MTFRRSSSGLSAMHLFFKVDVVVYCEGGPPKTVAEALALTLDGRTLDTMYWANLVSFQGLVKQYHFKSVGDKTTLLSIASDVYNNGITTVSVCVDADYDVQLNKLRPAPRLAHTHGYSWESDVLHRPVLKRVLTHLVGPAPDDILTDMENAITELQRDLVRWCEIDLALRAKDKPCVFDRKKPLSVVDLAANPPCLCHVKLRQKLSEIGYKRAPNRIRVLQETVVCQVAFGKLVSKLLYHIVNNFASRMIQKLRLDYDGFMRIAITETFTLLRSGLLPDLAAHMAKMRSAFS